MTDKRQEGYVNDPYQPQNSYEADTGEHEATLDTAYGFERYATAPSRRQRRWWLRGCLAIGLAIFAFMIVAAVVTAFVLPPVYRNMEPLQQEIWCNRADRYGADFVCDWKPTPPFEYYPTLEGNPDSEVSPEDLLLTPFEFDNPGGNPDDGSLSTGGTPVSQNSTIQPPPSLPTHTPSATVPPTGLPTLASTATTLPTSTPVPATATLAPPPQTARLNFAQIKPEIQHWNNCGPTTLTMGLSYFGYGQDQSQAASYLKPNWEDKNVSPWQMVDYVNQRASQTVSTKAIYRVGGNMELLKLLLANDFPVIIEEGYEPPNVDGWSGHYLFVAGYDDDQGVVYTFDSFLGSNSGRGRPVRYDDLEFYWRQFNYTYIVIYRPEREQQLAALLGAFADPDAAAQAALEKARQDANINQYDKWAWFNMGSSFALLGQYTEAATAFDRALQMQLPFRTLWYQFGPFEAYYHVGRYVDVRTLSDRVDQSSRYFVEEAWYYRGLAYAAEGNTRQALTELERVITFNPNYGPARETLAQIQNGTFSAPAVASAG
jgi:tetratricopeptide (TPR) repeat protein